MVFVRFVKQFALYVLLNSLLQKSQSQYKNDECFVSPVGWNESRRVFIVTLSRMLEDGKEGGREGRRGGVDRK